MKNKAKLANLTVVTARFGHNMTKFNSHVIGTTPSLNNNGSLAHDLIHQRLLLYLVCLDKQFNWYIIYTQKELRRRGTWCGNTLWCAPDTRTEYWLTGEIGVYWMTSKNNVIPSDQKSKIIFSRKETHKWAENSSTKSAKGFQSVPRIKHNNSWIFKPPESSTLIQIIIVVVVLWNELVF